MNSNSRRFFAISMLLSLGLGSSAMASPTVWNLTNASKADVSVHCASVRLQGLTSTLEMDIASLPAKGHQTYTWANIDNDGLGLNSGDWICTVKGADQKKSELRFHTQWDETVSININPQGDHLAVSRNATAKNSL
jgi:hypothetical protein